jgi:predicted MFS family arabinose efflux permease
MTIPRLMHIMILIAGVVVLDMGAQITQVANQTRIFGLVPSARSRTNTVYMTVYFTGGALGSWIASKVWTRWEYSGVFFLALSFIAMAAIVHGSGLRSRPDG